MIEEDFLFRKKSAFSIHPPPMPHKTVEPSCLLTDQSLLIAHRRQDVSVNFAPIATRFDTAMPASAA